VSEPSVSSGYAKGLIDLAESKGADRSALFARSGIDASTLDKLDNRVPFASYVALMRAAKALTGDQALALHYGEAANLGQVSIVGLIGNASETVAGAFQQLNRYVRLVVDVECDRQRFMIVQDRRGHWLVDTRKRPNEFPELSESAFAQVLCSTLQFGDRSQAREVHFTHADPGYRAEYERIFRAKVVFGAKWNAYRYDPAWSETKVATLPRYVGDLLNDRANELLRDLDAAQTVRGRVETLLEPRLASGAARMDDVAALLKVSRQTLHRQLRAEGVTFEAVLDDLRRNRAVRLVTESETPLTEIGYQLGFSDPATFSRAFKRWTGSSPRTARAARR